MSLVCEKQISNDDDRKIKISSVSGGKSSSVPVALYSVVQYFSGKNVFEQKVYAIAIQHIIVV